MRGNILAHASVALIALLLEAVPTRSSSEICRLDGSASRHVAFKVVQTVGLSPSVDADIHYRWVAITGDGGGSGSLFQTNYFDVGNLSWYGAPLGVYAGTSADVGERRVGSGACGLYDVRGRLVCDRSRLQPGIYFERKNGYTVKRVITRQPAGGRQNTWKLSWDSRPGEEHCRQRA